MNLQRMFGTVIASSIVWSTSALAQVVTVNFAPPDPTAVPTLSTWMTVLLISMLVVTGFAFLRKRIGSGVFMLMLCVALGSMVLKAENSMANIQPPPILSLVTSPAISPPLGLSCIASTLNIVATVPAIINSISATQGWNFVDGSSTCHAGTRLGLNGQCNAVFTSLVCTTPPVTTAGPVITAGPTDTTASVSVTIDKDGTGYYLVLPAASAVPDVAAVQAGTSLAMTAAVPATLHLTGLTLLTAYKLYFVAKDTSNNVQAAVSAGLAITTMATPDATPDAFTFVDQTGAALSSVVTSAPIIIAGINIPTPISIIGGSYSIAGGAYTAAAGTVTVGQAVTVRVNTSSANLVTTSAVLNVGGVTDSFDVTTLASVPVDSPTMNAVPTLSNIGPASFQATNHITDSDGISNIAFGLFAADGTTPTGNITGQTTGLFTGLTPVTTYVVKSMADVVNGANSTSSTATSAGTSVTTSINHAPTASSVDFEATHGVPTASSVTIADQDAGSVVTLDVQSDTLNTVIGYPSGKTISFPSGGSGSLPFTVNHPTGPGIITLTITVDDGLGGNSAISVDVVIL